MTPHDMFHLHPLPKLAQYSALDLERITLYSLTHLNASVMYGRETIFHQYTNIQSAVAFLAY